MRVLQVDNIYYETIPEERYVYKFRALCCSDECRIKNPKSESRTEAGVVKRVPRTTDVCPSCGHYLFWDRYRV